jgi:hypothetical protein
MFCRQSMRLAVITLTSLIIALPLCAGAEEVGNFTRVQNRVDYQKGETGPVTPAKVKNPVEVKDSVKTHEVSRAQVTFRDSSMITIAPKSKVAIENYMFDPSKFERSAKINLTQGVMEVVVPTLEKQGKPDFIIKTSTATMGIRD